MSRTLRVAGVSALIGLAIACTACGESLDFADWIIPVPDGTPVHEYAPVRVAERRARIDLVEDLVIGERDGDDNYMLYNPRGPAVAPDGRMYVLDAGNHRVQVFDATGDYIMTRGGEGQGPGEFTRPSSILIAGKRLYVRDLGNHRVSVWTLEGEYIGELPYPPAPTPNLMLGFDDGTMLGRASLRDEDEDMFASSTAPRYKLFTYGTEFEVLKEIHEWPRFSIPSITRQTSTNASFMAMRVPTARPGFAATHDGQIYTTVAAEYQVRAYDRDATLRWALRVAWPRVPIEEHEIVAVIERARENIPEATRSEVDWPEVRPALSYVAVDGHGHIYLYPYPANQEAAEADEVPVDVYSADGEHLFSGLIPALRWNDVQGDFVYRPNSNDDTGEQMIVRYRLVETF